MLKTVLLTNENAEFKDYCALNVDYLNNEKFLRPKQKIFNDIMIKRQGRINCPNFYFTKNEVFLKKTNEIYNIEYIPYSNDIVLPKKIQLLDWVVLFYEQTTSMLSVSHEALAKIKIFGNGQRIMGLDEPLICDLPFMSLRLTFLGDVDGWVVT